ncbi:MAG TPA: hypothetical protein VMU39_18495 [Solirubrobacteraceae bacterium]|nr:hypothetical protein [Solirubrobacteraceae bacterium]
MRDVLVGADHDHASGLAVHASQIEDVSGIRVRAEHLLVVDQPESALSREKDRRHVVDIEVAMALLEDRADVDHGVALGARGGEPADR